MRHPSRRQFLAQTAALAGTFALASGRGRQALAAQSGLLNRRHLINIEAPGGWDSLMFHNAVREEELAGVLSSQGALFNLSNSPATFDFSRYQTNLTVTNEPGGMWTKRYLNADLVTHPAGHTLAPGMSMFSAADLSSMVIWRGLNDPQGGHQTGNRINNTGTTGNSTPGFSSTVAQRLASDYVRGLHHVVLAPNEDTLFSQSAALTGAALPIAIPDAAAWNALTSLSTDDIASSTRRDRLSALVTGITQTVAGKFGMSRSKDIYSTFLASYGAAVSIGTSQYGNPASATGTPSGADFAATLAEYKTQMASVFLGHIYSARLSGALTYGTNLAMVNAAGVVQSGLQGYINTYAFKFAMAEFLVRYDLSAVVHMDSLCGDAHDGFDEHTLVLMMTFAGMRTLIRRLKAVGVGDGTGRNILDLTTIVMHNEFDRAPKVDHSHTIAHPGTNHWNTASLILAGGGVNGGKVIGDFKAGNIRILPGGTIHASEYPHVGTFRGYPVDPTTGLPSQTGVQVDNTAIFPTVLSAFDASGLTQITGPGAFGPVLKK